MSTKRYTVASVCRYAIVAVVLLSAFSQLGAQPWLAPTTEGATFFDIKQSFDQYWDGRKPDKGKGFKAFKRWEQYWRYRVNEDGTFPAPDAMLTGLEEYNQLLNASASKGSSMAAWSPMGPTTTPGGYAGLGRINAIAFHPTDNNIIWVGSPGGGLWKTTNGGTTWSTGYDNFSVLGVSSILVTPSNPNIMYVATGDGDAGDTRSIGVYKSTDGGVTWAATGLTFNLSNYILIRKLLMDPNDETHILAATSDGLYRTVNSGVNWTKMVNTNFYDVEAQPGASSNNFYAASDNDLYRSTDNGATWVLIQTIGNCGRIALGVSPANDAVVVALCSKANDSGFLAFYRSGDSGATFTLQSNAPNLLGWSSNGSDTGGQGWYDLVVAVDPTNASIIYVGGVNVWKSVDSGVTWTIRATWNGTGGVQEVHADHHAMEWQNNTTLFDGNDGGIYKTVNGGVNWTHHTNGMQISQMYRLGVSQTTNAVITGLQDNGTKFRNNSNTWSDVLGGDGMECAIDYSNAQYMYGELYFGDIYRSSNTGGSWTSLDPLGQGGTGDWITPYIISSNSATTLYAGYNDVYKSTNRGTSWTQISTNLSPSNDLTILADAPSDANVLYAGRSSALYRTTNGGTSWSTMTVPAGAGSMTYLCVSATDANTIYASMSNYTSGNKVYKSTNGGSTWTNISGTLPNLPANCILYQKGSPEGLYVGMDAGVYYRDNITNAWALVGTGLPNVVITELDIRYSTGKLRVSTYGRGLWETDINCVSPVVTAPTVTQPTCAVTTGTIVVNATGNATLEYSINSGTSWQTSNTFASLAPGSYNIVVRLQVSPTCSTSYSGNPVTLVAAVPPTAYNVTGGGAYCSGGAGVPVGLSNSQSGVNYQLRLNGVNTGTPVSGTGAAISFGNQTSAGTYTVVATNPSNSCTAVMTGSVTVTVNTLPSAAIAVSETSGATNNDGTICAGASATLTASGGGTYSWSNGAATAAITVSPATTTTYTVTVTDANTCSATATQIITVTPLPSASITVTETSGATNNDGTICSGATATLTAAGGGTYSWSNGSTTAAISVSPSSTTAYTVTVTSAGCTATSSVTITVNPAPSASIAVSETSGTTNNDGTICSGASVNLTATGGGTYLWSNGATTAAITVAPSATTAYIVTVTGTGSCTATASTTITVNPQPTASIAVNETSGSNNNDASICSGASATLTASGGSTYVWNTGAITAAITVSPGSTTTYSVTVTGTGGCTATAAQTITVSATPLLYATTVEPTTCASADGSINLTVTPSGSYTFLWSNGATTEDISNVGVGTYSVTVTNTSGCTAGTSVTLSGPGGCGGGSSCPTIGSASVTPSPICEGQTVTLSAAGLANMGSTYGISFVSFAAPTATPYTGGTTLATVPNGSLTGGGTGASASVVMPAAGTYYIYAILSPVPSDPTCRPSATTSLVVNALPTATISVAETSGLSSNDGTICTGATATLTAAGGSTYAWSNGSTGAAITVSPASTTTYTVTVTTSSGCTGTASTTITVNPLPSASVAISETSGVSGNDGIICNGASATLTAAGGGTYLWSTGATTASITVTPSLTTTYNVTVTNTNGCSATASGTVTVNPLPTASVAVTETSGVSSNDGIVCNGASATLTASGGTTYLWSNGAATASINVTPSVTTIYTVTVTNANNCSATATVTITVNPLPTASVAVTEISGVANNDGTICNGATATLTASGGTTYLWSNGAATASINVTPSVTTIYTVTVTNANNCSATATVTITVNPLPTAAIAVTETSGVSSNDGTVCAGASATLTASGGTAYLWSNGANTAAITVTPASTTTYTVTVTNAANCSTTTTTTITVNPQPSASISVAETSGVTNNDGVICNGASVTLTASGGATYLWSNGAATASITVAPSSNTTYTVTVTNAGNCSGTAATTITVNPIPTAAIAVTETSGIAGNDGIICSGATATLTASGGTAYLWSTGANTQSINVAPGATTTYSVTVTSAGNCSSATSRVITVNPLPSTYAITGGGGYCQGTDPGVPVGLAGSQTGVNYQLQYNGINVGAPVAGTGAALNFGPQTNSGNYAVIATSTTTGCMVTMTGSISVFTMVCAPSISDPCVCLNNATNLSNGQFGEQIKVSAPSNQTWTVTAVNGLYTTNSAAPPAAPTPITVGTQLTSIGGNMFTLDGRHVDALGYTISVSNGLGTTLSIGNSCVYPNPAISTSLTGPFCQFSTPVPLTGDPGDANIVSQSFKVNGVPATSFDPSAGFGQYLIEYTVNGGTPKAAGPNDPGCIQTVSQYVQVIQTPAVVTCNDLIHVSLDADCSATISADDLLEGSYGCYDDYLVEIDRTLPYGNGPWTSSTVTSSDINKTYQYRVTHLVSGNRCWGNVKIEDKLSPVITCTDITLYCPNTTYDASYLQNTLGIATAFPTVVDCDATTTNYVDTWHDASCGQGFNGQSDLSAYVDRKWMTRDASGNTAECHQYLYFKRLHNADLTMPNINVTVACSNGNTSPAVTGVPSYNAFGRSWGLYPDPGFCELQIVYNDQHLPVCDGTYKIVRTWTILDGCAPAGAGNPRLYSQVISVVDQAGPAMTCPDNFTVSVEPTACCAFVDMPDIVIEDACSRINNIGGMVTTFEQYTGVQTGMILFGGAVTDFGKNNYWDLDTLAAYGQTSCLPQGTHTVTYTAQDDCGNTSTCTFRLTVADYVPPVASCDETTTVAVGVDDPFDCYGPGLDACKFGGVTTVNATSFDDGSYDQCNGVEFTVRRMSPYSDCIESLNKQAGTVPCDGTNNPTEYETATGEAAQIKFYGCEVGTTQTVVLRVYQVDVNGNRMNGDDGLPVFNECMIQVEVQDKIKPVCVPPQNYTVTCEQFDPSLWLYGKASVSDNVCLDETKNYLGQCGLTHTASYTNFDTLCNKGTIVRTFRAFDCNGQSSQCTQRIVVNYEQDYFVRFPDDKIISVCDGSGDYGEPSFYGEDCELLGVTYEDEIFTVIPDACYKIERNWKVINWCTYNPQGSCMFVPNPNPNAITNHPTNLPGPIVSPVQNAGDPWKSTIVKINPSDAAATNYSVYYNANANCYTYKQIIKIIDTQDPVAQCPASPVTVCDITPNDAALWNQMYWWDLANSTHDLGDAPSDISLTASDACSGSNINFEYQLLLDLDGDGSMETVVNSTQLGSQPGGLGWNNVLYNNLNGGGISRQFDDRPVAPNQKWGFAIQEVVNGNTKTASVKFNTQQAQNTYVTPQLSYGTHKIKWFITDGCGNEAICEYTIIVKDCKAPTVVCYNGLSVNIMPTGMITMNDVDFLEYTVDNYSQTQFLRTGIRKCGTGSGFPFDANGNPIRNVTFNCPELGTQCVELWSIDIAGNADYCETYVIVQDNNGNCPNSDKINVSGALKTEDTNGVEEASISLSGSVSFAPPFSYFDMDLTDADGQYKVLNAVPVSASFKIIPEKDDNPLNGVTTYDLVLISKHILGIEPLGTPYRMIAADANKSNSVTTFDIVELRKLILGIYTELPNNTSWRFVDKAQVFANPANPFAEPIRENISVQQAMNHQFDQNFTGVKVGDVNGTAVANSVMQPDARTNGTLLFDVQDREVKAGEVFEVTFSAADKSQGYQMTLNLDGLSVAGIRQSEAVNESNFGIFADALTVSVDGADAFTVTFRAEKSGRLSGMVGVSSRITKAEGYSLKDGRMDVALRYDGKTIAGAGFELYQNQPNPFVNKTLIGFNLPEASAATLTVYDETGRMVFTQKGDFAKGYNTVAIDRALLNTNGVLYYTLTAGSHTATRKMIQTK